MISMPCLLFSQKDRHSHLAAAKASAAYSCRHQIIQHQFYDVNILLIRFSGLGDGLWRTPGSAVLPGNVDDCRALSSIYCSGAGAATTISNFAEQ
jgi:hypothetical protein